MDKNWYGTNSNQAVDLNNVESVTQRMVDGQHRPVWHWTLDLHMKSGEVHRVSGADRSVVCKLMGIDEDWPNSDEKANVVRKGLYGLNPEEQAVVDAEGHPNE